MDYAVAVTPGEYGGTIVIDVPMSVANVSEGDGTARVSLEVPAEPDGIYVVSGVRADGADPATGLTFSPTADGGAEISVDGLPAGGTARFVVTLTYQPDNFPPYPPANPGTPVCHWGRAPAVVALDVLSQSEDTDPSNNHASALVLGYAICVPPPAA